MVATKPESELARLERLAAEGPERLVHGGQAQATFVDPALIERSIRRRAAISEQRNQQVHGERGGRAHAVGHLPGAFHGLAQRIALIVGGSAGRPQQILGA